MRTDAMPLAASERASGRNSVKFVVSGSPSQWAKRTPGWGDDTLGSTTSACTRLPDEANVRSSNVSEPSCHVFTIFRSRGAPASYENADAGSTALAAPDAAAVQKAIASADARAKGSLDNVVLLCG